MDNDEFERAKQIDPDALDIEWLSQTELVHQYSVKLDEAISERDDIKLRMDYQKEMLETKKAELMIAIRNDHSSYNLDKVTEATVNSAIVLQPEYIKIRDEYYELQRDFLNAKERVAQCYSALEAIKTKKSALENLGRLFAMEYYLPADEPSYNGRVGDNQSYHKKINRNRKARKVSKERLKKKGRGE